MCLQFRFYTEQFCLPRFVVFAVKSDHVLIFNSSQYPHLTHSQCSIPPNAPPHTLTMPTSHLPMLHLTPSQCSTSHPPNAPPHTLPMPPMPTSHLPMLHLTPSQCPLHTLPMPTCTPSQCPPAHPPNAPPHTLPIFPLRQTLMNAS